MRKKALRARNVLIPMLSALAATACGSHSDGMGYSDLGTAASSVIGGTAVDLNTIRSLGLVNSGCSNSLIQRDWVLAADHCIFLGDHIYSFPRADGTLEFRELLQARRLGFSDLNLVQLQPAAPDSQWPAFARVLHTGNPADLVGETVSCYGTGASGYEADGTGLVGDDTWRRLDATVSEYTTDGDLIINAEGWPGTEITAPGDSGGPCFYNGELVAINSWGAWTCTNHTNDDTCRATINSVNAAGLRSVSEFASEVMMTTNPAIFLALDLI